MTCECNWVRGFYRSRLNLMFSEKSLYQCFWWGVASSLCGILSCQGTLINHIVIEEFTVIPHIERSMWEVYLQGWKDSRECCNSRLCFLIFEYMYYAHRMTWDYHWLIIVFCLTSLKLQLVDACAAQPIVMCFSSAHCSVDSQSSAQSWTWCFLFRCLQLNLVARSDDICHMRNLKNSIQNTNLQNDTRKNRLTRQQIRQHQEAA